MTINQTTQLNQLINIEKQFLPKKICEEVIKKIEIQEWEDHAWYYPENKIISSNDLKEPKIQYISSDLEQTLNPYLKKVINIYTNKFLFGNKNLVNYFS